MPVQLYGDAKSPIATILEHGCHWKYLENLQYAISLTLRLFQNALCILEPSLARYDPLSPPAD